jgi:hypothetical protein
MTSNQSPLKINDIDLDKITYTPIKQNKKNKIILLKYKSNTLINFVFQTPSLLYIKDNLNEIEIGASSNNFINFLDKLELKIKQDAKANAFKWFNTNIKTIHFQKIRREHTDYEKGCLKLNVIKSDNFETSLYCNNKKTELSQIPVNSLCKIILECYAIWINNNNKFGIYFRPILISFKIKEMYNYNLIDEESDESEENDIPEQESESDSNQNEKKNFYATEINNDNNDNNEDLSKDVNTLRNILNENDKEKEEDIFLNNTDQDYNNTLISSDTSE